jgi:hypothetical protein
MPFLDPDDGGSTLIFCQEIIAAVAAAVRTSDLVFYWRFHTANLTYIVGALKVALYVQAAHTAV